MRANLLRALRYLALTTLALLLALFAFIQIQQAIFHHHVVRLLADAQSIELHKSTWSDAQSIIHRWGRWDYAEGQCTSTSCVEVVSVDDTISRNWDKIPQWLYGVGGASLTERLPFLLGARPGSLTLTFFVQNGIIVRKAVGALTSVPPSRNYPYVNDLAVHAGAAQSLYRWAEYRSHDARLAANPTYIGFRPGSCTSCQRGTMLYSVFATPETQGKVSTFNTRCFAAYSYCDKPEDLLPSLTPFHINSEDPTTQDGPHACAVPVWARARDASLILHAQSLDHHVEPPTKDIDEATIVDRIHVLSIVKGTSTQFPTGDKLEARAYPSELTAFETLKPGQRYFIFAFPDQLSAEPNKADGLHIGHCSVAADTPENQGEIQRGMTLNDNVKEPDYRVFP